MPRISWWLRATLLITTLALTLAFALASQTQGGADPRAPEHDPQIGQSFQVPYRLTDTNHFLVRVRINGKGPFNFLVDSGAPALFIATETAKKIGLKPNPAEFWAPVDRLDFEGGARLSGLKARVDDPFQLVGMNALGLPGASIDGILGFTILARFRLEIDLTKDRMTWTRLNHQPRDPPVPKHKPGETAGPPLGVQAMSALGSLAKGIALFVGKQPEEKLTPRAFLGLQWYERIEAGRKEVAVQHVLKGSPAAHGGLETGDCILQINHKVIKDLKSARAILAEIRPGDGVPLVVRRGSGSISHELNLALTASGGL
jgi:hypothetical protein